jgi:hypothetical protein
MSSIRTSCTNVLIVAVAFVSSLCAVEVTSGAGGSCYIMQDRRCGNWVPQNCGCDVGTQVVANSNPFPRGVRRGESGKDDFRLLEPVDCGWKYSCFQTDIPCGEPNKKIWSLGENTIVAQQKSESQYELKGRECSSIE